MNCLRLSDRYTFPSLLQISYLIYSKVPFDFLLFSFDYSSSLKLHFTISLPYLLTSFFVQLSLLHLLKTLTKSFARCTKNHRQLNSKNSLQLDLLCFALFVTFLNCSVKWYLLFFRLIVSHFPINHYLSIFTALFFVSNFFSTFHTFSLSLQLQIWPYQLPIWLERA